MTFQIFLGSGGTPISTPDSSTQSGIFHIWQLPPKSLIEVNGKFVPANLVADETKVTRIKHGIRGKPIKISFPIDFMTKEWGSIVGAILSEGHIKQTGAVDIWNTNKEFIDALESAIKVIMPQGLHLGQSKGGAYYFSLPEIFGQILMSGLGLKPGKKLYSNPEIPELYRSLELTPENKAMVIAVLKWLFSGDGWITVFKDHLGQKHRALGIQFGYFENKPARLLSDTKHLLEKLDIRCGKLCLKVIKKTKDGRKTYHWAFFIKGQKNLKSFYEQIGFVEVSKQSKLKEAIESYVKPKLGNGESLELVVSSIGDGAADKHQIAKATGLKEKHIERLLKAAREKDLIEIVEHSKKLSNKWGGKTPHKYGVIS